MAYREAVVGSNPVIIFLSLETGFTSQSAFIESVLFKDAIKACH